MQYKPEREREKQEEEEWGRPGGRGGAGGRGEEKREESPNGNSAFCSYKIYLPLAGGGGVVFHNHKKQN